MHPADDMGGGAHPDEAVPEHGAGISTSCLGRLQLSVLDMGTSPVVPGKLPDVNDGAKLDEVLEDDRDTVELLWYVL